MKRDSSMTLDFGGVCEDGVAVVADTRMVTYTRDILPDNSKLAGVLAHVIFAYAGSQDMFKLFNHYVLGDLVMLRDAPNKYASDNLFEHFSETMRFFDNIRPGFTLELLVARHRALSQRSIGSPYYQFESSCESNYRRIQSDRIGKPQR